MNANTARFLNRLSLIFIASSLFLMLLGALFAIKTNSFLKKAVETQATVVELAETRSESSTVMFAPVFVFNDQNENSHKIYSSTFSYPPRWSVGDKMPIFYDPDNPAKARERGFFSLWGLPMILMFVGILDFVIFAIMFVITRGKLRTSQA